MRRGPYTRKMLDASIEVRHLAEAELRSAAAAHVDSRSSQEDSDAIGRLIAAAQAAAQSGMSLREIAEVIDAGARDRVAGDAADGASVTELRTAA